VTVRPGRKWLLEPVHVGPTNQWLNRCGAPPRQIGLAAEDSLALVNNSPKGAAAAADRELMDTQSLCTVETLAPFQVRKPPVPRMASSRRSRPCHKLKALPTSTCGSSAKRLLEFKPLTSTEVMEACYTRDTAAKEGALFRATLDQDILDHDFEILEMAEYRQAATFYYQDRTRHKASSWRKAVARKRKLFEVQWKLANGVMDISRKNPGDELGRPNDHELDAESLPLLLAPRSTPTGAPRRRRPALLKRNKKVKEPVHESMEGSEGASLEETLDSESEDGHDDWRTVIKIAHMLQPKQPRQVRMQRLKQNGRDWRQAKKLEHVPAPSSKSKSKKKNGVSFGADSSSDGSDHDDELDEQMEKRRNSGIEHRASQVAAFGQWSLQDQKDIRQVFDRFDNDGSDALDQSEMTSCLADLGLRGKNETERTEIREILFSMDKLEIGFYEFATQIVPTIRKRLAELQAEGLNHAFREADADESGLLSIEETLRELKLIGVFPSEQQIKSAILEVCPHTAERGRALDGSWLVKRDILNVDDFCAVVRRVQERLDRARADRLRQMIVDYKLDDKDTAAWQQSLVDTHAIFSRYLIPDMDTPVISKANTTFVVRECGLAPKNPEARMFMVPTINRLAGDDGEVEFAEFLKIGDSMRELDRKWLNRIFSKYDVDKSAALSLAEVRCALAECGINARTPQEKQELNSMIDEFDDDGSGEVDIDEFLGLFTFVSERLFRVQREAERQTSVRFSWSDTKFESLRSTFMSYDEDASESLDVDEMLALVSTLQRGSPMGLQDINPVLQEAGLSAGCKTAKVDFMGFMKIIKALEDMEHMRQVAKLYDYPESDLIRLRRAFLEMSPNDEGLVVKERLRHWLVDGSSGSDAGDLLQELVNNHPPKVNFEVFVSFMRKKTNLGIARRN